MVLYTLSIKANLQGVASLELSTDALCLDVRNPLDAEEKRERIVVDATNLENIVEGAHIKHHEKPRHFTLKWGGGERGTILVQKDSLKHRVTESGLFTPVVILECDNVEPYKFHLLGKEFTVINLTGHRFEKVDLSSGSWREFDLGEGSTEITGFVSKIE